MLALQFRHIRLKLLLLLQYSLLLLLEICDLLLLIFNDEFQLITVVSSLCCIPSRRVELTPSLLKILLQSRKLLLTLLGQLLTLLGQLLVFSRQLFQSCAMSFVRLL
jgi:hypothetical protein